MNGSDQGNFAALIYGCGEYYGKKLSSGVVEIYWQGLKSHSYEEIQTAVNQHMADPDSGQYMPKIADLKRILTGGKHTNAMQAWTKVDRTIRSVGPWESVCFDDPIVHLAIQDMGGWIDICNTPTEKDLEFKMHEFQKRYQGYLIQGGAPDHPKRLVGSAEAYNSTEGHRTLPPILIGNRELAQLVYEGGSEQRQIERARATDTELSRSIRLVVNNHQPLMLESNQ